VQFLLLYTDFDGCPADFGDQSAPRLFSSYDEMQEWISTNLSEENHDWMTFEVQPDGSTEIID
jgi:hypothetical protein